MSARSRLVVLMSTLLCASACGGANVPPGDDSDGAPSGPDAHYEPVVPPEVDGRITINEVMTANVYTVADDKGSASDWIELYNPTDQDIPIRGYAVTDDLAIPRKVAVTQDVSVPAGGHLVLWLDGKPELGPTHLGLKLADEGGQIGFVRPDSSFVDRVVYADQAVDFSAAREPDGSDHWSIQWHPTPGEANAEGVGQPVGAENAQAPPEQIAAAGDLSERILGYDVIPELALVVSATDAAKLEAKPFEFVPAQLIYEGRSYGPVGLRLKGVNSFEPFSKKPSLRVSVNEYDERARFFGLKDLTLNNMHSDFSMLHERLSYFLARKAGVVASRANHAHLKVNGVSYGLYINVETVKHQMIKRWFDEHEGPLFEATDVDFVASYIPMFELESGPDDRGTLSGLAAALTNPNPDAAIAAASEYVDIPAFQRYWAMCSLVAQFDAFPYSNPGDDYFAYADPETGKLSFIPWGMDETFYSGRYDVKQVRSVLATKCMDSPACFRGYVNTTWALLEMSEDFGLEAERQRLIAQIAPYVAADTRKSYSNAQVADFQQQLYWFIAERRQDLATMLPPAN